MEEQINSDEKLAIISILHNLEAKWGELIIVSEISNETTMSKDKIMDILNVLEKEKVIRFEKGKDYVTFFDRPNNVLLHIDSKLYNEISEIVQATKDPFDEKVQDFVEKAIKNKIASIKYNIEGGAEKIIDKKTGYLRRSEKTLTMCLNCWRPFLKLREDNRESAKLCPSCKENIFFFSSMLEQQDPDFRQMKELGKIKFEGGF
jgi:DNA-binding transcriptional regulator GbsR (MarR family)